METWPVDTQSIICLDMHSSPAGLFIVLMMWQSVLSLLNKAVYAGRDQAMCLNQARCLIFNTDWAPHCSLSIDGVL